MSVRIKAVMCNVYEKADESFSNRIYAYCLGGGEGPFKTVSTHDFGGSHYIQWDGNEAFEYQNGKHAPITRRKDGAVIAQDRRLYFRRIAAVFNEAASLGHKSLLRADMQDARRFGFENSVPDSPILTYNRRTGAKNLILWPLLGYHSLGHKKFVHLSPLDDLPFDNKLDKVGWRGSLTGRSNEGGAAAGIMMQMTENDSDEAQHKTRKTLLSVPRYNIVNRYIDSEDIDVGLTIAPKFEVARNSKILKPLCKPEVPMEWFFKRKYILSISGNDTGSNFLLAANSNSVVFKEEDDWELFYSGEFRAWEHYVPLRLGAIDLEEKLSWARSNQTACKKMIKAAQRVCAKLASPTNRQMYLSHILSAL